MADDQDRDELYDTFYDKVNMQPKEIEEWLETDESTSVGDSESGESTGHESGRKLVEIKRTNKADLTDDQWDWMEKTVGYINRHCAQVPDEPEGSDWCYSLKNWGHDPMKDDGCA